VRERHYATYRSAVEAFGGRPLDAGRYWARKRRGVRWAELLVQSEVAAGREAAFLERFVARIEAPPSLRLDRLFPGVPETLDALRLRGDRLVLLSLRRSPEALLRQVHDLGIAGAFERICSGQEHAEGHRSKVHLIRQVQPGPWAVLVGDTEADVLAAKQLGLPSVGVSSGLRTRGYLRRVGADVVVDGVRQLPAVLAWLVPSPSPAATQAAWSASPSSSDTSGR
jgi:phosphoglycolate phosphatase-like HAD superfamily hydrolase